MMEGWADGWMMDALNKQNVPQLTALKKGIVLSYEANESHQPPLLKVPLSSQPTLPASPPDFLHTRSHLAWL